MKLGLEARPKRLPPFLFYDAAGTDLFEEITRLPEYYLTRTELALFEEHGRAMIARAGAQVTVVELGAGSGRKTSVLLRAVLERQGRATFLPIDVSRAALDLCAETLQLPGLVVEPVEGRYGESLATLRDRPGRKLVLFIGSSIGNFDHPQGVALLREVRAALQPGDALLLGTDLRKDPAILLPAYDDPAGVTARFNKNMLARLNREYGADFEPEEFRHVALWNDEASRMEMHLESRSAQVVTVGALDLEVLLDRGERIHTENSYKFTAAMVERLVGESGFILEETWTDPRGWFAEHLARAA